MEKAHELVFYNTEDGKVKVDVVMDAERETMWATQKSIAQVFGVGVPAISKHISHIYEDGELDPSTTLSKMETVVQRGFRGEIHDTVDFYNLDMIIAVGYRVNSKRATQFRIWATGVLKDYIRKGFAMDDERLKNLGGGNYWKELLDRIRDIRSSEKILYRQVLDLYATSVDYDPRSEESVRFFKIVQNKLHYAAHGHTAAEVIYERADAEKPFMGLTTFSGEMPTKKDISVAKNYLDEKELKILNNLVSGYFDLAEIQALEHTPMYMSDHIEQLNKILTSGNRKLLEDSGTVSHEQAMNKAESEYRKYQANTLSGVEKAYLETIKQLAKKKGK